MGGAELVRYGEPDGEIVEAEFRVVAARAFRWGAVAQLAAMGAAGVMVCAVWGVLTALGLGEDMAAVAAVGMLLVAELVVGWFGGGFAPAERPWREW